MKLPKPPRNKRLNPVWMSVLAAMSSSALVAQPSPVHDDNSGPTAKSDVDHVIEPVLAKALAITYPVAEVAAAREGWVEVDMMVDAKGKPFEVAVVASSGNKDFEEEAVHAVEAATYYPGLLNGHAVESATKLKIQFAMSTSPAGARAGAQLGAAANFVQHYRTLQGAVDLGDKAAADDAMHELKVRNMYEDAYFGLASYLYARRWGDLTQQLAGLRRAIAYEKKAKYLPDEEFRSALVQCLALEVRLHHYAEAQDLWVTLQSSGAASATLEKLRPLMLQIDGIRNSDGAYDVAGSMPEGAWQLDLYKHNFRFKVSQGQISNIGLHCANGFLRFDFDPTRDYAVDTKYGACSMDLKGAPGTQFTLTQF